ncbi:DMT family transporter [Shimia sp. R10_1]|uniref:DMT family transporter n=1 Tax=Shimia sp. R10_1 TaxID=2821095 RepID=UPI001FFDF053|nr:DMT family transporter [Shimia sp. R10_1]
MFKVFALMFVAMSMIPAGDTAGKLMMQNHEASPIFVAWSRFALGALMVVPLMRPSMIGALRHWGIWLRGALMSCGIFCIQNALQTAPIADVFAAFFIGPIFSYLLSVTLLKEPATPSRNMLMAVGFIGVLLVVRPSANMSTGLLYAVGAGMCYGTFLTISRWLSGTVRPTDMLVTQLVLGALILTPLGLPHLPESMTLEFSALTVASAAFSMGGNLLLLFAYRRAEAAQLAPLVYLQLLSATALGWVIFGTLPATLTWVGLTLILGAGVLSAALPGLQARRLRQAAR